MGDPSLPPSRFGPGYTVGPQPVPPVGRPVPATSPQASAGWPAAQAPAHVQTAPAPPSPPAPPRTNPWAAVAFFLTLFFGTLVIVLTIPMALVVRRHIARTGEGGKGLTTATLLIGCAYLALGVTVGVLYFVD